MKQVNCFQVANALPIVFLCSQQLLHFDLYWSTKNLYYFFFVPPNPDIPAICVSPWLLRYYTFCILEQYHARRYPLGIDQLNWYGRIVACSLLPVPFCLLPLSSTSSVPLLPLITYHLFSVIFFATCRLVCDESPGSNSYN